MLTDLHWQNSSIEANINQNRESHAMYTLKPCNGVLLKTRSLSDQETSWINVYGWILYENITKHLSYNVYEDSEKATDTDMIVI